MATWLFKEEPSHYSFADLERDGTTLWTGVTNALARIHLRKAQVGDVVFYYHTGDEKAIVGEMTVASTPGPDPETDDKKGVAVKVAKPKKWPRHVSLAEIKADDFFQAFDLVKNSRLSVMPVPPSMASRLRAMSKAKHK